MWSSCGEDISNLPWHVALLSNVSSEKTSLRKTNQVEFSLEVLVLSNLLAGLFSNMLHVVYGLTKVAVTNLDAMDRGIGA